MRKKWHVVGAGTGLAAGPFRTLGIGAVEGTGARCITGSTLGYEDDLEQSIEIFLFGNGGFDVPDFAAAPGSEAVLS